MTLHRESWGSGRALLILPSNGGCAAWYRRLGEALATRCFATTAVTLPGFDGRPPLVDPSWHGLVDAVMPLVAALPPDGVLVGHSLGGLLAFLAAARRPVGHLVLLEPAISPVAALARRLAEGYRRTAIDVDRSVFRNTGSGFRRVHDPAAYPRDGYDDHRRASAATDPATLAALAAGYADLYPLPWERVRGQVSCVRGGSSGWLMWAAQVGIATRLGARRATLPRAGHWMVNEQDDALAGLIADLAAR